MGYTEEKGMLENMQQLLAFLAASCPSLVHISLPYLTTFNFQPTNQLRLLVNSFTNLRSLTIKMCETSKGFEQLAMLHSLENLHLVFSNDRKSQEKLSIVFASLKRLRKVTIGAVSYHTSRPGPARAIFVNALVSSNPDLKEICTDTWEGGVKVSQEDKSILKKKCIKHHEVYTIPDSDMESEEEDEVDDEEEDEVDDEAEDEVDDEADSDEDSDGSEEMENSESSGEESSEDDIEGEIVYYFDGNGADEADIEGGEGGANFSGGERSILLKIAFLSFTLLSLVCYLRLYGNYFFGNLF